MVRQKAQLNHEDACAVLVGAAMEAEAAAVRVAARVRRLEAGGADDHLVAATRRAAVKLVEVGKVLRRDGLLGVTTLDRA